MPSRSAKISVLLGVDIIFFFIELIVGYAVGSLALVADSFHMLNDVMSLIVALYAIKLSKSEASPRYSYGWHRAEIVAALINGVFLLALCFSIFMEAIERFFKTPEISNAKLVVIVGSLGLASNILGIFLFHEHSHSHEGSHGVSTPTARSKPTIGATEDTPLMSAPESSDGPGTARNDSFTTLYGLPVATRASVVQAAQDISYRRPMENPSSSADNGWDGSDHRSETSAEYRKPPSAGSMNMRALILHVLGDALSNVGVISTGLVMWLSSWPYKYYFDPVISLVITVIIFSSAMPLVRSAAFILLQGVPATISLENIREDIQRVQGVLSVHELHIWQLSEDKVIASVHVWVSRKRDYMHIAHDIRKILHDHNVHSSTIQPEFHNDLDAPSEDQLITTRETHCLIPCPPGEQCAPENACCPPLKTSSIDV